MTYLLDANIISEIRTQRPDPSVLAWWDTVDSAGIYISVLTIGEIRMGIERLRRKDAVQADAIERWLIGLRAAYLDHIVGIDVAIAEEWARLNAPDPLPIIDGLLAATARTRGWTLVTRNEADFGKVGITLLNPFGPGEQAGT